MAEDRPFPPSPRRLALARRAGLTAASPLLVGGVAVGAGVLALAVLGRAIADRTGRQIVDATSAGAFDVTGGQPSSGWLGPGDRGSFELDAGVSPVVRSLVDAIGSIGELLLPLLAVIAVAAIAAHVAQTRAIWLPRRRVDDAPALEAGAGARTRTAALELARALAIGGVAVGWLFWAAPRLSALPVTMWAEGPDGPLAAGALVLSGLTAIAIAWIASGAIDALLRHAAVGRALRMTAAQKREDERMSSADPRWRRLALRLSREPDPRAELARATLLVLGDDAAVAIAFDPLRQPTPTRVAVGKAARATQLLALARHYRLPIHRDPALATALVAATGPVPEAHWPRLADLVAATRR